MVKCSDGAFRIHKFGYDWRDKLQNSSDKLISFASNISLQRNNMPVHVVARTNSFNVSNL